jgi:[acyl-carrier-protein] S-malonyltransferase
MKLALCFPGQGSQEVGMGRAFARASPAARAAYTECSSATGLDLERLCFEGPLEELTETANQQPALVATSLACLAAVEERFESGLGSAFVVGHSVGEYAALAACGALSRRDAVSLVRERGLATAASAHDREGAMAAVLGLDDEVVEELCAGIDELWPANYNCPGQIVVSGAPEAIGRLAALAEERGARRIVPLRVTGAFHSPLVESAAARLRPAIEHLDWHEPRVPFMSTVTASFEPGDRLPGLLVEQLTAPVRFSQAVTGLIAAGADMFVEVGPGQVLSGLVRRIDRSVTAVSVGDPDSLARLEEALTHGDQ